MPNIFNFFLLDYFKWFNLNITFSTQLIIVKITLKQVFRDHTSNIRYDVYLIKNQVTI